MSRRCELTGKGVQSGNLVSHSNRKTRTRFLPNLVNVTLTSDALARSVRLRISAAALRSVEHRGGLDAFLAKAHVEDLSQNARELKRDIAKKHAAAAQACPAAGPAAAPSHHSRQTWPRRDKRSGAFVLFGRRALRHSL